MILLQVIWKATWQLECTHITILRGGYLILSEFVCRKGRGFCLAVQTKDLLVRNFNEDTVPEVMCTNTINVGWNGQMPLSRELKAILLVLEIAQAKHYFSCC